MASIKDLETAFASEQQEYDWALRNGPEQAINAAHRAVVIDALKVAISAVDERKRAAEINTVLASKMREQAMRVRERGTFDGWELRFAWPPFKRIKCIMPRFEAAARGVESAANALESVAYLISNGDSL